MSRAALAAGVAVFCAVAQAWAGEPAPPAASPPAATTSAATTPILPPPAVPASASGPPARIATATLAERPVMRGPQLSPDGLLIAGYVSVSGQERLGIFDLATGKIRTLNLGGQTEATNMKKLADAITLAGRWLATPDPNDPTGTSAAIVAANLDMVNFRCDNVKFSTPLITRGNDNSTTNWVEIIHLSAFVSYSNTPLPN